MAGIISTRLYREFREERRLAWKAQNAPCHIGGHPIDYDGAPNEPNSFELDHVLPRKTHPHLALDPGNARPSCSKCNRSKGAGKLRPGIGQTSEEW